MSAVSKRKRDDENVDSVLKEDAEFSRVNTPFPRGGGSVLAPLDIKRAAAEATSDVFESTIKSKKHKRNKSKTVVAPLGSTIEPVLFNNLKIGTLLLGQISDIKFGSSEFVVSLPNNLVGYCKVDSKLLVPELVGRYLRFAIIELGQAPHKRIELSYDPEFVNQSISISELTPGLAVQGLVTSVEEKGLLIDMGSLLGQGFVKIADRNAEGEYTESFPVLAFITESERRVKSLTLDVNKAVEAIIEQPALVPGTLVKSAPVERESSMGSVYNLLGHLKASSDAIHSQNDESKWVRVLFSYPPLQINGERQLGVSRLAHILSLEPSTNITELKAGKKIEVTVSGVWPNVGLVVNFDSSGINLTGFVHVSQIARKEKKDDEKVDLEREKYSVGTTHDARILGVSSVDGIAYFSLDRAVINQRYMSLSEIKIGDVVPQASVDRILPKGGVLIRLSTTIVGIASEQELSDVALKNPETRYKPGQKVSCRVLDIDLEKQSVKVTLKKSIVDFDGPILRSFSTLNGEETVGTVIRTLDAGALIGFFGGVKGLLPLSEMSEAGTTSKVQDIVWVGQTVRAHVITAVPNLNRLIVSTRPVSQLQASQIGEVYEAEVSSKNKKEIRIVIATPPNEGEAALVGDTKNLKVGDKVTVKVLTDRLATADKQLVEAELPKSVDDLEAGQQLSGYVSGTKANTGLFVSFLGDLTGLVPANVIGNSSAWPTVGKTIKVVVDTVDFAHQRVYLSMPSAYKAVDVTITAVKDTQLNVTTTDGEQGRIDISQLFPSLDEIKDPQHPLTQFEKGQQLKNVAVIGRHDARNHRFLPLSHRSGTHVLLELSLNSKQQKSEEDDDGKTLLAFVNNYSTNGQSLFVTLSTTQRGQLSLVDLSDDIEVLAAPEEHYPIGSALKVTVLKGGAKPIITALTGPSDFAQICEVEPLYLLVRLPYHKTAKISCVDTGDDYSPLVESFDVGDITTFKTEGQRVTLRSSSYEPVKTGDVCQGFVYNIAKGGVFVALGFDDARNKLVVGRVKIGQLSDNYQKDWQALFKIGDVVDAKVLSTTDGKIELSLKLTAVTGRKQPNINKVDVDTNYNGTVCRIETFGVFVEFDGVRGLCHHSEISDYPIDDLNRVFKVGDKVRIRVLSKDVESGKLSLGMKARYFDDDEESDAEMDVKDADDVGQEGGDDENVDDDEDDDEDVDDEDEDEEEEKKEKENSDEFELGDVEDDSESEETAATTGLSAGFEWSGGMPDPEKSKADSDFDSDSESDSDDGSRRRRRTKKREEFVRDETAALHTRLPESAKDFERLLVATPNSAMIWMNFMAFELQLGEIEAARQIGLRALKTISQREEAERLNIWVALLNLEAQFGSRESTEKVFKDAQQYMDALTMHLKMATVYSQASKMDEAKRIYERAQKRFGSESLEIWLASMRFLFGTADNRAAARAIANRALQRLPARLHRDFTRQFALLEFEMGDAERGRTLFEALLDSAPKRVDIWNVYIDQELKLRDEAKISALFERVLQQSISMKQAKFFFKKWIDVASDQEYVKSRAREYVEVRESRNDEGNDE